MKDGKPVTFDPNDEKNPVEGDLFVDTEINGIKVKSTFLLLAESAKLYTIEKYAEICGVKSEDIVDLAKEFV